jgi:CubicO group peptidase (beta-lactamase class C family)
MSELIKPVIHAAPVDASPEEVGYDTYGMGCGLSLTDLQSPGTFNHEGAGRSMLFIDPSEELVYTAFIPTNIDWVPESVICVNTIIMSGLI